MGIFKAGRLFCTVVLIAFFVTLMGCASTGQLKAVDEKGEEEVRGCEFLLYGLGDEGTPEDEGQEYECDPVEQDDKMQIDAASLEK